MGLAGAWEPHQLCDGIPVLNVRRVLIDTESPTEIPQGLEKLPLHELVALNGRLEAERAEMSGELIVPGKISGLGVRMVLDTGASVSLISTYLWKNLRAVDPRLTLMPTNAQIRTVSSDLENNTMCNSSW